MTTRRNLCPNPAAGVDLTGWSGTVAPTRVTGQTGLPRTTGVQATTTGYFQTPVVPCSPGDQFTVSFYMKNGSSAFQFAHTVYVSYKTTGADAFPETFSTPQVAIGDVVRASKVTTVASVPSNATGIYLVIDTMPAGVVISGVLIEKVDALDTYFDGTYPDAAWDGAADLSSTTRTYTLETVNWPSPPTIADAADGTQDYNMGLEFSMSATGYCYGVEWNPTPLTVRAVPGGQQYAQLWNIDTNTVLAEVPFTHSVLGGLQRIYFDQQPFLTTGVRYGVTVYTVSYVYRSNINWTITSPSGKIHADKGRLVAGARTSPGAQQDAIYFVAPVMSFGAVAPSGPQLTVWNGTAEVPATLTVWDGTTEQPGTLSVV